ncbi:MAG TPA: DUF4339 domain-containing protein [Chthoniobacter sp.]|jgi:hypothetical protein
MHIYIMRDGQRIGPFSRDAAQILIQQGTVSAEDLAWQKGCFDWLPLGEVLESDPAETADSAEPPSDGDPPEPNPAEPPEPKGEPASATQIAFLTYFGIATPAGLTRDAAEDLISQAKAEPRNARRVATWETDRSRLHPDLFSAESDEKKEDRVQLFYDLCLTAGADHFTGITKAHCQVLVAFLDVAYPRWDANRAEATERYFFPAIAEKFPQLVTRAWRGRLHYNDRAAIIARATRGLPKIEVEKKPGSFWVAVLRGIVLGLVILVVLYFAHNYLQNHKADSPPADGAAGSVDRGFLLG